MTCPYPEGIVAQFKVLMFSHFEYNMTIRSIRPLILSAVTLVMAGCGSKFNFDREAVSQIEVGTNSVVLASSASTTSITVNADGNWTASVDEDAAAWLTLSKPSAGDGANSLTLNASENNDIKDRLAVVTIVSGTRKQDISILQHGLAYGFKLSTDTLKLGWQACEADASITSNVNWKADWTDEWLSVSPSSGEGDSDLNFSLTSNISTLARYADVKFVHSGVRVGKMVVRQDPITPELTIDKGFFPLEYSREAFQDEIKVSSNYYWTAYISASDALWLNLTLPQSKREDGLQEIGEDIVVSISAPATQVSHSGKIFFKTGDRLYELPLHQQGEATVLTVSTNLINAPHKSSTQRFTITSNNTWEIRGIPDWITSSAETGFAGETEISLDFEQSGADERSAEIEVVSSDKTARIKIVQAGGSVIKNIVFANATTAYRNVLTPKMAESLYTNFDLGPVKEVLTSDPTFEMEFYSIGSILACSPGTGLRIQFRVSQYPIDHAIRSEQFAYIKFPAIEGVRLTKVTVVTSPSCKASTSNYITSTYGTDNADALAHKVSEVYDFAPTSETAYEYELTDTELNTAYYLMLAGGTEYQILSVEVRYMPDQL